MLTAHGVSVVVLTKGSEGVQIHTPKGIFNVAAQRVEVVDTIGAGDSFNGGFLAGLRRAGLLSKSALRDADLDALLPVVQLAVKVAAITVSRAGANPPWANEMSDAGFE
jgi:fructokinase